MDILAGRKTTGQIAGSIAYAGRRPSPAFLRRHCSVVEQFDSLVDNLTVREMLMYTAELKCPRSEPLAVKKERVEGIVAALNLERCRDTVIGSALHRGISGGQLKR